MTANTVETLFRTAAGMLVLLAGVGFIIWGWRQ
jgi:hypothetical protein